MNYFKTIFAIIKKDILLEIKSRQIINSSIMFALLITVIFSFIFNFSQSNNFNTGAVFWTAVLFSGILSLNKSMDIETENDSFTAILNAPVDKSAVFFGKCLSNFIFLTVIEALLIILFTVFFNTFILKNTLTAVIILLSTYGYAVTGTLFAIISAKTKSKDILLPLIMLPIISPVIIGAVLSTNILIDNKDILFVYDWIKITAVFDIIMTTVISVFFSQIIEE